MQERKTVLYIHHSNTMGGAPKSLADLITRLPKDRFRPFVLLPEEGMIADTFASAGAEIIVDMHVLRFPGATTPENSPIRVARAIIAGRKATKRIRAIVQQLRPDIVHLNSSSLPYAAKGARQGAPEARIICHCRETLAGGIGTQIIRHLNHRYCDVFIALDEDGLSKLKTHGRIIRIIPNGVDTSIVRHGVISDYREKHGIKNGDIVVLTPARICPVNGTLEAISLIRKLPSSFAHVHFVFLGYQQGCSPNRISRLSELKSVIKRIRDRLLPPYTVRVERKAKRTHNVSILPFEKDVMPALSVADIVFCPFVRPHFARAVVEAASVGVPSLVPNIPSLRRLVRDHRTGLIYQPHSYSSFRNALEELVSNRQLREYLGQNAKKYASQHFDVHKNTDAVFQLYD